MIKFVKFRDVLEMLNEYKQVGILYHYTSLEYLFSILNDNEIKSFNRVKNKFVISFTRDKNWHHRYETGPVRITINGNKLSNNYKIQPYHDLSYFNSKSATTENDEMEEMVYTKEIINITDYIIEIIIIKNNIDPEDKEYYAKVINKLKLLNINFKIF